MKEREALMLALEALEDYGHAWPRHVVQYTNAITAIKKALAQPEQETVGPSGDSLSDFQVDQWWVRELDFAVANGTHDQKRAVSVVRNMLATIAATARNTQPPAQPEKDEDAVIIEYHEATIKRLEKRIAELEAQLAQPDQEPVAWITQGGKGWLRWHKSKDNNTDSVPLYTTPPQRKPLTDEQIAHATAPVFMGGNPSLTGIARAIEAAHGIKEKNT